MKSIPDDDESVFSGAEGTKRERADGSLPPIIDYASLRDYERLCNPSDLARAVFTMENESVLIRRPFMWWKDGEPMPDAHTSMKLDEICTAYGWKIVASFGHHFAIVAPEDAGP
jgi:hypothetical protein